LQNARNKGFWKILLAKRRKEKLSPGGTRPSEAPRGGVGAGKKRVRGVSRVGERGRVSGVPQANKMARGNDGVTGNAVIHEYEQ